MSRGSASLVRRALRGRRGREALTAAGVAASTVLVLVLLACYRSLALGAATYAGQAGVHVWVAPRGTDNLIRSGGFLPAEWAETVRAVPGVAAVDPILRTFATADAPLQHPRRRLTLLVIAYRTPGGLGGPPLITSGRAPRGSGELALDRAAAFRLGVGTGDSVRLGEQTLRVVGLSRGTNLIATQFAFGDYQQAEDVLGSYGRASFLGVRLGPGLAPAEGARRIAAQLPHATVITGPELVANNLREVASGFLPLLLLLTTLGLGVAAALVALLTQGLVEDRRADVAVLLALGAPAGAVAGGVAAIVAGIALAGGGAGTLAAWLLGALLDRALPTVELTWRGGDAVATLALFTLCAVLAALAPIARLRRVDPLEAFRP